MTRRLGRRDFIRQIGEGVTGGVLTRQSLASEPTSRGSGGSPAVHGAGETGIAMDVGTVRDLPTRPLGRVGLQLPPLSFGTAAMGHAFYEAEPFEEVMNAAIDAGIRYIDTARIYDVAEERLRPVLAKRRQEVFLVTKTWAKSKDDCIRSLEKTMSVMGVDTVDLCHIHNVGGYETEQAIGKNGCLAGLQEARRRGLIRYVGCTGHLRVKRFLPVISTGEIDVLMCAMNFVDRHTYNFEEKVLPIAQTQLRHRVYEGLRRRNRQLGWIQEAAPGRLVADEHRQQAFDYALSIPGVATCVVGMKTLDELRLAIQAVRRFQPLDGARRQSVLAKGAEMATEWGPHFGEA